MKPLILSFFAVILGYSLFLDEDKETKLSALDQNVSACSNSGIMLQKSDTVEFYANKTFSKVFLSKKPL